MTITLVDVAIFLISFIVVFTLNNEKRSIMFDIVICLVFFGKVSMGVVFYKEKTYSKLRLYMSLRFIYDCLIALVIVIFDKTTQTYPLNYLVCLLSMSVSEIVLAIIYSTTLCLV